MITVEEMAACFMASLYSEAPQWHTRGGEEGFLQARGIALARARARNVKQRIVTYSNETLVRWRIEDAT